MITITDLAAEHFRKLLKAQGDSDVQIRLTVLGPNTPQAETHLSFCIPGPEHINDLVIGFDGFYLYVDNEARPFLEDAVIDYQQREGGGKITVKAPKLKIAPKFPEQASLKEKVQYILDYDINPAVASHGGRVSLVDIDKDNIVYIRFGGGCQGCGMADVTLTQGIQKAILEKLPEITQIVDLTNHAEGEKPYY